MSIVYQSPLLADPKLKPVSGTRTLSVSIQIVAPLPSHTLDFDYQIVDSSSAVHFAGRGKITRRSEQVTGAQMSVNHRVSLVCGPGYQHDLQCTIVLVISCAGQPMVEPTECIVGISGFTCPETIAPVVGASALVKAFLAQPFATLRDVPPVNTDVAQAGGVKRGKKKAAKKSGRRPRRGGG